MTVKNMTKYFTRASATYCGIWRRLYLASRGRGGGSSAEQRSQFYASWNFTCEIFHVFRGNPWSSMEFPYKLTYVSWRLTQKRFYTVIGWLICDSPDENSAFSAVPGFARKGHWTQANQILPDVRGLTINRKNFWKIRTDRNSAPT